MTSMKKVQFLRKLEKTRKIAETASIYRPHCKLSLFETSLWILGFLQLSEFRYGDITMYTDCLIVPEGFRRLLSALSKSSMLDTWFSE